MANKTKQAEAVRQSGRYGDTELVHVNSSEKAAMEALFGPPTKNPETGLDEHFWGAALGGASVLAGGILGDKKQGKVNDKYDQIWDEVEKMYDIQRDRVSGGSQMASLFDIYGTQIPEALDAGFEKTAGLIQASYQGATQQTMDMGEQLLAKARSSAVGRGMYNTSVNENMQRGVNSDIGRQLTNLASARAGDLAGLSAGVTQGKIGALQGSAGLFGQQLDMRNNIDNRMISDLLGREFTASQGLSSALGFLGGSGVFNDLFGGGGGGGGNAPTGNIADGANPLYYGG